MKPAFWRDRRVLVTGHTGFKGSWMCLLLDMLGARVSGYALEPPTRPSLFDQAKVDERVNSALGDVRDLKPLLEHVRKVRPEVIFHMAAQSVVLQAYSDPMQTFATNVMGTATLFEAVRLAQRPCCIVNITSDKCYANNNWVWGYRETDPVGGRDPYSASKGCAELVTRSYRESYFPVEKWKDHHVSIASARAGNVIGGGDWTPRQLIPEAMSAFASHRPVVLRHPEAVRPWQHVLDCLVGYLRLAEALHASPLGYSGEWNFGPADGAARPVSFVVETLARHWDVEPAWMPDGGKHPHEEEQLRLDSSKAARRLGWRCHLGLEDAIEWVARWYRAYWASGHARELCQSQIRDFLAIEAAR